MPPVPAAVFVPARWFCALASWASMQVKDNLKANLFCPSYRLVDAVKSRSLIWLPRGGAHNRPVAQWKSDCIETTVSYQLKVLSSDPGVPMFPELFNGIVFPQPLHQLPFTINLAMALPVWSKEVWSSAWLEQEPPAQVHTVPRP
mmetsp:Transcript_58385/g.126301  ORF Transcript_58385/g.126301 Transcript_58385/m.126301 type:complete len:145 (-) Transcript_58385:85-519(-)